MNHGDLGGRALAPRTVDVVANPVSDNIYSGIRSSVPSLRSAPVHVLTKELNSEKKISHNIRRKSLQTIVSYK